MLVFIYLLISLFIIFEEKDHSPSGTNLPPAAEMRTSNS